MKYLAMKKFLEILIPLVYCLILIGSYIGPNYEIMGGIGSDIWHYDKVSSLRNKLQNILRFMAIELFRGILLLSILWKVFRLNLHIVT